MLGRDDMKRTRTRPQRSEVVKHWLDPVTLWACEDNGRRRDYVIARHCLLMKVIERKALESFRRDMGAPRSDWRFHLDAGLGHDLGHLEEEAERILGGSGADQSLYDDALKALGDARRAIRRDASVATRAATRSALLMASERLYDRIERLVGKESGRAFLADGLARTEAWLAQNADPQGRLDAQKQRLQRAIRRL